MEQHELEELSREAAGKLPDSIRLVGGRVLQNGGFFWWDGIDAATADKMDILTHKVWLHESTEACTEIMVRVLWPRVVIVPHNGNMVAVDYDNHRKYIADNANIIDPMLAYRVAVLRALVAGKGEQR